MKVSKCGKVSTKTFYSMEMWEGFNKNDLFHGIVEKLKENIFEKFQNNLTVMDDLI